MQTTLTPTRARRTMPPVPADVMTVDETAERYGVSRQRVYQWLKAGLPVAPESPRDPFTGEVLRTYIRAADVATWRATQPAPGQRGPDKAPRKRTGRKGGPAED